VQHNGERQRHTGARVGSIVGHLGAVAEGATRPGVAGCLNRHSARACHRPSWARQEPLRGAASLRFSLGLRPSLDPPGAMARG
jgi:hypothetical protein